MVCDDLTNYRLSHGHELCVSFMRSLFFKICTQVFVSEERTIAVSEDTPCEGSLYIKALHFISDLHSVEVHFSDSRMESCDCIIRPFKASKTLLSLDLLSITNDNNPLVSVHINLVVQTWHAYYESGIEA